jgi:hypothetical protein
MNFLQYADGSNTIEEISKIIKIRLSLANKIYATLKKYALLS